MLLSSSSPGGGPYPQTPCWRQAESNDGLTNMHMFYKLATLNLNQITHSTNINDRYLSTAMASSIVLASTVPSSGIILFTFSSSGTSRWLFSVQKFNFKEDKGGIIVQQILMILSPKQAMPVGLTYLLAGPPVAAPRPEASPRFGNESLFHQIQPPSGICLSSWHSPHPEVAGFPSSSPEARVSSSPCHPATVKKALITVLCVKQYVVQKLAFSTLTHGCFDIQQAPLMFC